MNIKLSNKIITEICGTVSFKRGAIFCRSNRITFESYRSNECRATVSSKEEFHVMIDKDESSPFGFRTKCSCPSLASYKLKCQHVAAVLLSIHEHQRNLTSPAIENNADHELTEGIFTLFNHKAKRSSMHQLYFENREMLETVFICKPLKVGKGQNMIGIELKIATVNVKNLRNFLMQVKTGSICILSDSFTYDPSLHCFQKETDAVIHQLIQIIDDEKMYGDDPFSESVLMIPPSSWERLVSIILKTPLVKWEYGGITYDELSLTRGPIPVQFSFLETKGKDYELKIQGLNQLIILEAYRAVLSKGCLIQLEEEVSERLSELKQILDASEANHISVPHNQFHYFLEEIVPELKKLGDVHLAPSISMKLNKPPLIAKLYLDRIKNKLLAGLEFHYEGIVINPLESGMQVGSMFIRDEEKEEAILQLMEESSFAKTESGYFLHNEELEYTFLRHVIPQLQPLVQIYATTAVRNRLIKKSAPPRIRVKANKERTNWLEFKFEMDGIPEKHIRDILFALEEKRKYYRLANGTLLSLETREFEEIRRFLNAVPNENLNLENGLYIPFVNGLHLLDSTENANVFKLEESFHQFIDSIQNPDELKFELPERLDSVLREYQKEGYRWMKTLASFGFGGILADDMGLGKTLQSIAFILSELPRIRQTKRPVLIVCPSSLMYNWLSEISKFTPDIHAVVLAGHKKERVTLLKEAMEKDVLITSYPLLRTDLNWYRKQGFHTVFFDEAQAFKNPNTQTAKAVKTIQAEHHFALTGTPIENSLEELWSIYHVVFPELFQGLKEYSNLTRKKIIRRIRPFLLRRMKKDVLAELPEKVMSHEFIELLPDQKKLYAAYLAKLRHETLKHLDKDTLRKNRIKILAGLTRLRQICCHPALFVDGYKGSSAKFEQLRKILKESKLSGRRVLIFSQFTTMLQLIGKDLARQGIPYFYLDGQTPAEERIVRCNRFNGGERDLFLISLKAGGTGLNLTGADTVILYDIWWNPAVEEQAADRAYRIGQANTVEVIKLIARGTIEEKINELQEQKKHLIAEIIDTKEPASSLTEEDIREILMI
ncbi:DEAD/DEAH box helicase [Bacillus niameyensis]|uniref:DEAD/DEAH box helicase n=1 Tax=Bacillus niameyensis TaxID=1522308 RepID=UPI000785D99D|nr:DEAD/DEAH box helicase [Bacillus niameyensis]